jgi:uncharacterized membrane protein YphA (DoxX/SURF4 family)
MATLLTKLGRIFFALPLLVFSVEYLARGRWQGGMPPVPPWTHGEHIFSYVAGAILLVISISLLINKEARLSANILGLLFMFCVVFLHAAKHFSGIIHDGNTRTRAFETFALGGAAFILAARLQRFLNPPQLGQSHAAVIGRYVYAFSMVIFGIQHFMYAQYIAFLIPKWMPAHLFLAYFTGTAFIAAGVAIAVHIFSRLASILLGLMFFLWVLTLHTPRVIASPHNTDELVSLFVALAFSGSSILLAAHSSKKR